MQRFSHKASSVLEKKIFKGFYHIYVHGSHLGQWMATILAIFIPLPLGGSKWNLSNIGPEAPEEKLFEILNIFPIHTVLALREVWESETQKNCPGTSKIQCQEVWDSQVLTLVMLNKFTPSSNFQPIRLLYLDCCYKLTYLMANNVDPDQMASSEANWSGSILFAKAGHIRDQQDKG